MSPSELKYQGSLCWPTFTRLRGVTVQTGILDLCGRTLALLHCTQRLVFDGTVAGQDLPANKGLRLLLQTGDAAGPNDRSAMLGPRLDPVALFILQQVIALIPWPHATQ